MPQEPGDEALAHGGQVVLVVGVKEGVLFPAEQRLVNVHAAPVLVGQRLGHEGGVDALPHGHLLHHQPVGHGVVGHGEGVGVAQVDLVLAGGDLVVAGLDGDAHLLQGEHGLPAQVAGRVQGCHVEVAALVQGLRALRIGEVEVLQLRPHVEHVAQVGRPLEVALQDVPRVPFEGGAVGLEDIAHHSRHPLLLGPPGEDDEGVGVGHRHHVALIDAGESLDRRAVESLPLPQRQLQFLDRDRKALQEPQDVREPETDELDVVLPGLVEHVLRLFRRVCHAIPPLSKPVLRER